MREEKKRITAEYLARLNGSPYFIGTEYTGMTAGAFVELRKRLRGASAELHVVKNSVFRVAAKEAGLSDLTGLLSGQVAVVTGRAGIFGAAKIVKNFAREFERPKFRFGYLGQQALSVDELNQLADLPPLESLRGQLAGLLLEPGARIARVIKMRVDQSTEQTAEPAA